MDEGELMAELNDNTKQQIKVAMNELLNHSSDRVMLRINGIITHPLSGVLCWGFGGLALGFATHQSWETIGSEIRIQLP